MSYIALLTIFLIATIGGVLNEVAEASSDTTRNATFADAGSVVSSTGILVYSDTEQNRNASNTDVTAPGMADIDWWEFLLNMISWDFVYFSGQLQIVRAFMFTLTISIFAWFVLSVGSGLLGAIKNAAPG